MSATEAFLRARDFLLAHGTDYATAYRDFAWPRLTEFNWALDYFDRMAVGNESPALWIVEESASSRRSRSPECRCGRTRSPTGSGVRGSGAAIAS